MSRKKDEKDVIGIAFIVIWVCCSIAFGWVVGTIIAVLSLICMFFEDTSSNSKHESSKGTSKPTKSMFEINEEYRNKEEERKKAQIEKEMDNYGLSDEEKELVKKGEWKPYQFEEEELEEDDYYYEDDD